MRPQRKNKSYIFMALIAASLLVINVVWRLLLTGSDESKPVPHYPLDLCEVAIGITTTGAYLDRVQMQENTWLQRMCSQKSNYRFITDENSTNNNYIFSACPNDYNSVCCKTSDLVHKLYAALPEKKWYMKCDDDSYVVPSRVVEFLSTLDPQEPILAGLPYYIVLDNMCTVPRTRHNCTSGEKYPHVGGELKYTVADNFAYPAGGPCYAFSNTLARRMVEYNIAANYSKYCHESAPFEDLMIARVAHDVGGYVVDGAQYFWSDPPKEDNVKSDTACCYHMWNNSWKTMNQIHDALYSTELERA